MTKIILNSGEVEFLSAGAAREKVAEGKATFPKAEPYYTTRQMKAAPEKKTRKRKDIVDEDVDNEESV